MPAPPYRICFVCLGNICRSPMAAVVMRRLVAEAGLDVQVDSAGTGSWHVGNGANPPAVQALARRGYDGSAHAARQFGPADFADYDLVIGLDRHNVAELRRLAPDEKQAATIRLLRDFDRAAPVRDRAAPVGDRAAPVGDRAAPVGDRDVPDPYGGSDTDFDHALDLVLAACAGLLQALLLQALGQPARRPAEKVVPDGDRTAGSAAVRDQFS